MYNSMYTCHDCLRLGRQENSQLRTWCMAGVRLALSMGWSGDPANDETAPIYIQRGFHQRVAQAGTAVTVVSMYQSILTSLSVPPALVYFFYFTVLFHIILFCCFILVLLRLSVHSRKRITCWYYNVDCLLIYVIN